ncbi:lipocalin family protein [Flavobacteriaceae bacterium 3-367]|uniref:lipocalin family protein n=1 Tax=Eudoraea algarum TaxID=3417568 RepID=UPI00326A4139
MKHKLILLFLAAALTFSCSSDSEDDNGNETPTEDALVGTWDLTTIEIDDSVTNDDLEFAKGIVEALVAQDCDLLTLTFAADGTLTIVERDFSGVSIDVNSGGDGLSIACPETQETDTVNWSLDGDQLTITFEDQTQETVTIQLSGNTLTVGAEFVDEDNLAGAEAVFEKR